VTYLTRRGRRYAAIVPLDRIKEPVVPEPTYTAAIGLISSVVAGDHCDVTVAENNLVGYRSDEPEYVMGSNIVMDVTETAIRTDDEDVAGKVYDAADDILTANGWRRVTDWDDAAGDAAYARVERA
jgi:hypothetical protein